MTQRIEFSEEMVGNAHPTKSDTLNKLINLITGAGGILFGTGVATAEYRILPKFSAHKNGVNQTGIVSLVWTKITFTTEEYDIGSAYDAGNSKWIPGIIGKHCISANVYYPNMIDQSEMTIAIYKNGVIYKRITTKASATSADCSFIFCQILVDVVTDYFEIYIVQVTGGDIIIWGVQEYSWFMGHMLP